MSELAEEMLYLISKKGKIEVREIQGRFNLTKESATTVIDFLAEFGFVQLDEGKRYVMLSEPCKRFFEESIDHDRDESDRLMLTIAYL